MIDPRLVIAPVAKDEEELASLARRAAHRGFVRLLLPTGSTLLADEAHVERLFRTPGSIRGGAQGPEIPLLTVRRPADLEPALDRLRSGEPIAIRWTEERVIPLENLIASRTTPGTLWVVTDRPDQVPAILGALEHGADHAVVEVRTPEELDQLEARLDHHPSTKLAWQVFPVRRVVPAGMGDRVLVDTTSLLAPEEGLLVGSQAAVLLHVASEAIGSRYTRPRPFRVNAGAAHMYTLLADGETRYLSELMAGDPVIVARPEGTPRVVHVGRIKIERRPLVLVEVERDQRRYTAFLQEAETVRVSGTRGRVATTELRASDPVHGVLLPPARHLGTAVTETIEER